MEATRLSKSVWAAIQEAINKSKSRSEVVYGKVQKVDESRKLLWVEGFGNQPVPVVGWKYKGFYYDTQTAGLTPAVGVKLPSKVVRKEIVATPAMPKKGQTVVVLRQFGERRLPKCVGVLLSTNFVEN